MNELQTPFGLILGLSARFSDPLSVPFAPQGPGSAGGTGSESVERIETQPTKLGAILRMLVMWSISFLFLVLMII